MHLRLCKLVYQVLCVKPCSYVCFGTVGMPLTGQLLAVGNYSVILFSCTFRDAHPPFLETHIKHKEPAKSDWHYPKLIFGLMPCHHRHHQSSTAFAAVHGWMPQHFLDVFSEGSGIVSGLCVCAH